VLSRNFGDFADFSVKTAEIRCPSVSEKFQKLIRRVKEAGRAAEVPQAAELKHDQNGG
jgi:hypothetical protein